MTPDSLPVLVYLAAVLAALLLPFAARGAMPRAETEGDDRLIAILLAGGSVILTIIRHGLLIDGAVLLVVCALGFGLRALAGATAAALLLATTSWWLAELEILPVQYPIAAAACLAMALLARKCSFEPPGSAAPGRITSAEWQAVAALLAIGLTGGLLSGATNASMNGHMAWHHWGAYVSPVNALLGGGVPFRDFPIQYGMGPTLLFAAACGEECWTGLYWVTVAANTLFLAVCGWSALMLTRNLSWRDRLLTLAALCFAVLIWAGYPCDFGGAVMTPSVGGMRFLPLAMLTALILTAEQFASRADTALPRRFALPGHALWLLGLAWSPEAGFFATLLWWPWLALRRADAAYDRAAAWQALLRGGVIGIAAVLAGYAGLAIVFRIAFGDWVSPEEFLLYLRYPPGRLPINPYGPIWFISAAMLLAVLAMWRTGPGVARRSLYVCLLAALATTSYFVSRSFDNNFFNLLPSLIVLLVATQAARPSALGSSFLRASLAGIIALAAAIHWHSLAAVPGASNIAGLQIGPAPLVARFAPSLRQTESLLQRDVAVAYDDLRAGGAGAILLFDDQMVMPTADPAQGWTGVNNSANFEPLPPDVIRHYVRQGAKQYRRSGWLLASNSEAPPWLEQFGYAYAVNEQRRYGSYTAYHMVPRDAR